MHLINYMSSTSAEYHVLVNIVIKLLMLTHQRYSQVNFKVFSNTWTLLKISPNHTYSYVLMSICCHSMPSTVSIPVCDQWLFTNDLDYFLHKIRTWSCLKQLSPKKIMVNLWACVSSLLCKYYVTIRLAYLLVCHILRYSKSDCQTLQTWIVTLINLGSGLSWS